MWIALGSMLYLLVMVGSCSSFYGWKVDWCSQLSIQFPVLLRLLLMYHCLAQEAFFSIWLYNTQNHWNVKKSSLQICIAFKILATITQAVSVSGDCNPLECHWPLPVLSFLLSYVLFTKSWWKKAYWLLTEFCLLHSSTYETKVLSLHICGV